MLIREHGFAETLPVIQVKLPSIAASVAIQVSSMFVVRRFILDPPILKKLLVDQLNYILLYRFQM